MVKPLHEYSNYLVEQELTATFGDAETRRAAYNAVCDKHAEEMTGPGLDRHTKQLLLWANAKLKARKRIKREARKRRT